MRVRTRNKRLQSAAILTIVLSGATIAACADQVIPYPTAKPADAVIAGAVFEEPTTLKQFVHAVIPPHRHLKALPANVDTTTDLFIDRSDAYVSPHKRGAAQRKDIAQLNRTIRADLVKGAPSHAAHILATSAAGQLLDPVEYDQIQAQIAASYFYAGKPDEALTLASASAARSGRKAPLSGWIGGLSAWRLKDYGQAAHLFETAATSPYASSWSAAAGYYWAYRANTKLDDVHAAERDLNHAAAYPRTFYGLIAAQSLGRDIAFNWDLPKLNDAMVHRLQALPGGRHAIALTAAGQTSQAETALRSINPGNDHTLLQAMLAFANENGMPGLAMRLAIQTPHPGGGMYDAALYPLSPWTPQAGYKVDPALIHAIIRQESRFDPAAESQAGAEGLMQLMPDTAQSIHGAIRNKDATALNDPALNLELGQRYVVNLLNQEPVDTDLFSLVTAYNAGPNNLRKWKSSLGSSVKDDPLLFLESVPMAETRAFAERVMANYWIYRLRLSQPAPSLEAVADGHWAKYVALKDTATMTLASAD